MTGNPKAAICWALNCLPTYSVTQQALAALVRLLWRGFRHA